MDTPKRADLRMRSEERRGIRILERVSRLRTSALTTLSLLLLAACGKTPAPAPAPKPVVVEEVWWALGADNRLPAPALRYPQGSRIVRTDVDPPLVLTEGMAAAGYAVPGLDGGEILFTGKEDESEPYGLWACRIDGSGRRRLVLEATDCGRGAWLPDGSLVYAKALDRPGPVEGMRSAWALFHKGPDEARGTQITFGAGCDVDPAVLDDGRVVYASWQPVDGGMYLWTVHPDGTGAARLPGDHGGVPFASLPRVTPKGLVYQLGAGDAWFDLASCAAGGDVAGLPRGLPTRETVVQPRVPRPQGHLSMVRKGYTNGALLCLDARHPGHPDAARVRVKALDGPHVDGKPPEAQVLGEVPLEEDGSFFLSVPADTPLLIDVLDARGRLLDEGVTPFWVRPNETRACIGCHEKPCTEPPNRRPDAVLHEPFPLLAPDFGGVR